MAEEKLQKIEDFMSCTGILNKEITQDYLSRADWDLLEAIKLASTDESQKLPSEKVTNNIAMADPQNSKPSSSSNISTSLNDDFFSVPSTSSVSQIKFNVFNETLDKLNVFNFSINDTIGDLKRVIQKEWNIPACHQVITGFPEESIHDDLKFGKLSLGSEVQLSVRERIMNGISVQENSNTNDEFTLSIYDEVHSKDYRLVFDGSKKVSEVKNSMAEKSNIPVIQQQWVGWPPTCVNDEMMLSQLGLNKPTHNLSFRSETVVSSRADTETNMSQDDNELESDDEPFTSFDDDDEEMGSIASIDLDDDVPRQNCVCSLVPEKFENETSASLQFAVEFQEKYGIIHPDFFPGTMEDAFKEACHKPAKDRKLFAIYLHNFKSILTNVFCSQLLCAEAILHYLNENFITWGWDITIDSNKIFLCRKLQSVIGQEAIHAVKNTKVDKFPIVLIISRVRRSTEILSVIHADVNSSELLTQLIHAVDIFEEQRTVECKEEAERTARELIKVEQDQAYQQSLEVDRAKLEAKRKQEQLEEEEMAKIQDAQEKEAAKKEAHRRALESRLPPEPKDETEGISKIRIRVQQNQVIERKFLKTDAIQVLLDFVVIKGYDTVDYKLITSYPRRDLTQVDPNSTFESLKLYPQETLILEER